MISLSLVTLLALKIVAIYSSVAQVDSAHKLLLNNELIDEQLLELQDPGNRVEQEEIDEILEILKYSPPSYCIENLANWTCTRCSVEVHERPRLFGDFENGVFGYAAYNPSKEFVIVSFRGTRNLNNWISNLKIAKPDAPWPLGELHL